VVAVAVGVVVVVGVVVGVVMTLDLDGLGQKCRYARSVQTCVLTKAELGHLVRIAEAAILCTKYQQATPELELLVNELRQAGLL